MRGGIGHVPMGDPLSPIAAASGLFQGQRDVLPRRAVAGLRGRPRACYRVRPRAKGVVDLQAVNS